jgi:hypothetical protein
LLWQLVYGKLARFSGQVCQLVWGTGIAAILLQKNRASKSGSLVGV